jgi:hypothetical protein
LLNRRALLLVFASASMFSILFGTLDVAAAVSDTARHCSDATSGAHEHEPGDDADHCHDKRSRDGCDDDHCRDRSRTPTRPETAVPSPKPSAPPAPASTAPPARARETAIPRAKGSSLRPPAPGTGRAPSAAGPRPPVLAPPPLTIPVVGPVIAGSRGLWAGYVIALSTVLVAATIAVVSLVLVRRSG